MSRRGETVSPTALIIIGAIALAAGILGIIAHSKGYGMSRTGAGPLLMICTGGIVLAVGIIWSIA